MNDHQIEGNPVTITNLAESGAFRIVGAETREIAVLLLKKELLKEVRFKQDIDDSFIIYHSMRIDKELREATQAEIDFIHAKATVRHKLWTLPIDGDSNEK